MSSSIEKRNVIAGLRGVIYSQEDGGRCKERRRGREEQ